MVNWTSFVLRYGLLSHDDVIIWKHFPCYWPFVRGIHRPRSIPRTQRPVTRRFDVFFDLRLNKRLSKQPWGWWFETLSRPLWRHRNVMTLSHYLNRFDSSSKVSCGIHVRYLTKTGYDINRFANYTCTIVSPSLNGHWLKHLPEFYHSDQTDTMKSQGRWFKRVENDCGSEMGIMDEWDFAVQDEFRAVPPFTSMD